MSPRHRNQHLMAFKTVENTLNTEINNFQYCLGLQRLVFVEMVKNTYPPLFYFFLSTTFFKSIDYHNVSVHVQKPQTDFGNKVSPIKVWPASKHKLHCKNCIVKSEYINTISTLRGVLSSDVANQPVLCYLVALILDLIMNTLYCCYILSVIQYQNMS